MMMDFDGTISTELALFNKKDVRGFIGTTQPSDSSRLPQQLRLPDT
jgi:hypothetical protein